MHLRRVQIPDYRVLQGVDLRFDAGVSPQVFPLGSENGGGKSTLLQLVFVLLHCAGDPERAEFVHNVMASFVHPAELAEKVVARFELEDGPRVRTLEFVSLGDRFLRDMLGDEAPESGFAAMAEPGGDAQRQIDGLLTARHHVLVTRWGGGTEPRDHRILVVREQGSAPRELIAFLERCRSSIFLLSPPSQPYLFLADATRQLFVSGRGRRGGRSARASAAELRGHSRLIAYLSDLERAARALPGFFAYDWVSVDSLVKLFQHARDRDFARAVEAGGQYGTAYVDFLREVNALLQGKEVRPLPDLSGVEFIVTNAEGVERVLGPEDLSRGELKRLMIFAWLRANATEDAIVLMDEIELSLHPDWQYRIVRDLVEWAPAAQFVLATHSHEVCQAVTPAHVRELEPRLAKRVDDGAAS